MLRRILVPLDPSVYSQSAMETACMLARRWQAEVSVLAALDQPGIERTVGGAPAGAIYYAEKAVEHAMDEARRTIMDLLPKFRGIASRYGVAVKERELTGDPEDLLFEESKYHDLLVMGLRSSLHFATEDEPDKGLHEVLRHILTPVLAVPQKPPEIRRVLVAYDGSLPASRSLQRFAQVIGFQGLEVSVLTATEEAEKGQQLLARTEEYLRAHGARSLETVLAQGDVKEIVESRFGNRVDVVVLGVHSKLPVLDFLVGSLTKRLIDRAEVAVFLAQ